MAPQCFGGLAKHVAGAEEIEGIGLRDGSPRDSRRSSPQFRAWMDLGPKPCR